MDTDQKMRHGKFYFQKITHLIKKIINNNKKRAYHSMIMFTYCAAYEDQFHCYREKNIYFVMAFCQRANGIWISQDSNPTSLQ